MEITTTPAATTSSAVVMVGPERAIVARTERGRRHVTHLARRSEPEPLYLLRIARAAAECDRLVVMGPGVDRLAFEREYVSLYQRPDRLVDVPDAGASNDEVLERLRRLEGAPDRHI